MQGKNRSARARNSGSPGGEGLTSRSRQMRAALQRDGPRAHLRIPRRVLEAWVGCAQRGVPIKPPEPAAATNGSSDGCVLDHHRLAGGPHTELQKQHDKQPNADTPV